MAKSKVKTMDNVNDYRTVTANVKKPFFVKLLINVFIVKNNKSKMLVIVSNPGPPNLKG